MKRCVSIVLIISMLLALCACGGKEESTAPDILPSSPTDLASIADGILVELSDKEILVDGTAADGDNSKAVYIANDIVYYEEGHDFTYGEGESKDEHSAEEADEHTVVHITKPGTYALRGTLSNGQIAVDLGEDAQDDPNAVVTLVLDGVDITCTVAPAVIFYNVYECGDKDNPTKDVDTSAAGANVILADGKENTVNGSYVARIYKPDTVELNEDGTEVEDAKKLHKYDAAFYSKMSMNIDSNNGILNINAENEGLDSEMHLTINGGSIKINSGNDGINTNEDGVSVTTINDGLVQIIVTGETGEGDGIDSNGWLVINGGTVIAQACSFSGDAGVDSDMGIHINGGSLLVTGNMLDRIEDDSQNHAVFTFAETQSGGAAYTLKDSKGTNMFSFTPDNDFSILVFSFADLVEGEYTLWKGETQLAHSGASFGGGSYGGGMMPGGPRAPESLEGVDFSKLPEIPDGAEVGKRPEGFEPPEGFDPSVTPPAKPEGERGPVGGGPGGRVNLEGVELTTVFAMHNGANYFSLVSEAK